MLGHFQNHRAVRTAGGGHHVRLQHLYENGSPIFTHVFCQRFFATSPQSSHFKVTPGPVENAAVNHPVLQEKARRADLSREALLHELINTELDSSQRALVAGLVDCQGATVATEVDPWLDATRWQQLFKGVRLLKAARLGHMPVSASEPDLCVLAESDDRLVDQAYAAVCDDRVSFCDQFRINSFVGLELVCFQFAGFSNRVIEHIFTIEPEGSRLAMLNQALKGWTPIPVISVQGLPLWV